MSEGEAAQNSAVPSTETTDELKAAPTLESVIRDLYSREINCRVSTFWDSGITVELGDAINGFTENGNFDISEMDMAAAWLAKVSKTT